MEVVADTVDKEPDDNMDEVYTEDMVVEGTCKAWVALLETCKVVVVDMVEIQLMDLLMVLLEMEGGFAEVASSLNVYVVEKQHLREFDLVDMLFEYWLASFVTFEMMVLECKTVIMLDMVELK